MTVTYTVVFADQLVDGHSTEPVLDGAVAFSAERIAWVGPAVSVPSEYMAEATVHQYTGCTVLPGFVDAHTHFTLFADGRSYEDMAAEPDGVMLLASVRNAWQHLSAGVTTARDNGSRGANGFLLRQAIDNGIIPGPRLLVAGPPVTPTRGHFYWCGGTADGVEGVQRQVRDLIGLGADHIKIMASGGGTAGTDPGRACYSIDELRAAVTTAHDLGRLTTAHCRASQSMDRALSAAVDCIEHGEFMDPDGVMRFDETIARRMAEQGTYLSPTLPASGWDTIIHYQQICQERELTDEEEKNKRAAEDEISIRLQQIAQLNDIGLSERIVAGTDAGCFNFSFGHIDYAMHLMVAAGMTEMAAIKASTSIAARACGVEADVGSLAPGKVADIVVVRGNPLENIDLVAEVKQVFHRGVPITTLVKTAEPVRGGGAAEDFIS
jgi:imidazolonepropionase-like amidohydrolase